jgi:hypothetical protein
MNGLMTFLTDNQCLSSASSHDGVDGKNLLTLRADYQEVINEGEKVKAMSHAREEQDEFTTVFHYGSHWTNWQ